MRRNLLRAEVVPNAPYFLLALPEHFYLWKTSNMVGDEVPPDYVIEAAGALTAYYGTLPWSLPQLGQFGLEMLMNDWLKSLVTSALTRDAVGSGLAWLFESGLYESIQDGLVRMEI